MQSEYARLSKKELESVLRTMYEKNGKKLDSFIINYISFSTLDKVRQKQFLTSPIAILAEKAPSFFIQEGVKNGKIKNKGFLFKDNNNNFVVINSLDKMYAIVDSNKKEVIETGKISDLEKKVEKKLNIGNIKDKFKMIDQDYDKIFSSKSEQTNVNGVKKFSLDTKNYLSTADFQYNKNSKTLSAFIKYLPLKISLYRKNDTNIIRVDAYSDDFKSSLYTLIKSNLYDQRHYNAILKSLKYLITGEKDPTNNIYDVFFYERVKELENINDVGKIAEKFKNIVDESEVKDIKHDKISEQFKNNRNAVFVVIKNQLYYKNENGRFESFNVIEDKELMSKDYNIITKKDSINFMKKVAKKDLNLFTDTFLKSTLHNLNSIKC